MASEDDLYEAWKNSTGDERCQIEKRLFEELVLHATKVAAKKGLFDVDLARKSASEVVRCMDTFRGECKFSTFSEQIIKNHLADLIDERVTKRERFLDIEDLQALPDDDVPEALTNEKEDTLIREIDFDLARKAFSEEQLQVLDFYRLGLNQRQIAKELSLPLDNIEAKIKAMRKKWKQFKSGSGK